MGVFAYNGSSVSGPAARNADTARVGSLASHKTRTSIALRTNLSSRRVLRGGDRELVNVTLPVFNEARRLGTSLPKLHSFLSQSYRFDFKIVIVDNGSTDGTLGLAEELARQYAAVNNMRVGQKGGGRALKAAWGHDPGGVRTDMDVVLATDLAALPALVEAVESGRFDLAIGSRLAPGAQTQRGWKRDLISQCYMGLVKTFFHVHFSDAQCGFKAITREAARKLLPLVEDTSWFFDTELLVLAEKLGYRICDVPVTWTDDPDSRVRIVPTAWADLKGLMRVWRNLRRGVYADSVLKRPPETNTLAAIP